MNYQMYLQNQYKYNDYVQAQKYKEFLEST